MNKYEKARIVITKNKLKELIREWDASNNCVCDVCIGRLITTWLEKK